MRYEVYSACGIIIEGKESAYLDGILNLNKPKGVTAHDMVAKVRKLAATKRVGHAGTLDPAATGVLPILIGNATRLAEYLSDAGKAYRATIALGLATPSYDLETAPLVSPTALPSFDYATLEAAVSSFLGPQMQTPPMYSAIHVGGQRLYELARVGKEVERAARPIVIHSIKLVDVGSLVIATRIYPTLTVDVECSKGTYIRSLAVDIGAKLGVAAVLAGLERTRSGPFRIAEAWSPGTIAISAQLGQLANLLYPLDYAVRHLPRIELSDEDQRRVGFGQSLVVEMQGAVEGSLARAYSIGGCFVAILRLQAGKWQPHKVFLRYAL